MPEMLLAAAYIRVSTEDQTEFSPDAQLKALKAYAKANNMILQEQHIYRDEGISGRKAEKRPGFMTMIAAAKSKAHPFDVILVHRFDRFARSREDSVVYKSMLRRECGVRVISITESIEDDKFSVILESMLEGMAEYYSINLADEVKKGMTEKALRGELQTSPPFGYRAEGGTLVPDEQEAPLVREIFDRLARGESYWGICRWLNDLGIRTHRGGRFENRTVEYIIHNPAYLGKLRWTPGRRSRFDYADPNSIVTDAKHTPLITQGQWDAAQARSRQLKAQYKYYQREAGPKKHWLQGTVRCGACGSPLLVYYYSKHRLPYFKCGGYQHGACTEMQHIRVELLESAFLDRLRRDAEIADRIPFAVVRTSQPAVDSGAALRQQLETVARRRERLLDALLSGAISNDEFKAARQPLDESERALRQQLSRAQLQSRSDRRPSLLRDRIIAVLQILEDPQQDVAAKSTALRTIIDTCIFTRKPEPVLQISYRITI